MTAALITNITHLRDQTAALAVFAPILKMAVEVFDEALLRARSEPLPGHPDQPEEDPLVLRMQAGVGSQE